MTSDRLKAAEIGRDGKRYAMTPKQEKFARRYMETGNASEAWREIYSANNSTEKTIWENASRLLANPKVASWIVEEKARIARESKVTVEEITSGLREMLALATRLGQASAGTAALHTLAKVHGLIIERRQDVGQTVATNSIDLGTAPMPIPQENQEDSPSTTH